MAVTAVFTSAAGAPFTAFGVQDAAGSRLIVASFDRAGGETMTVTTEDATLTAAFSQAAQEVTLPADANNRRSVFLWEAIIPPGVADNPIITVTVLNGASAAVDKSIVSAIMDEGTGYELAQIASANSGVSTVTSQVTGTTASVPAADVLVLTAEVTRGATTATWTLTDNTPPNPGGGDWDLSIVSGTGNGQRRGSVGYYTELAAASQTWSDTVNYGTTRMASALIAVFAVAAAGEVTLAGTGDNASDGTGTLSATRNLAGTGDTAADAVGTLGITRNLTGTGGAASEAAGTLSITRNLAGTGDVAADGLGTIAVTRNLVGTGSASSDGVASLTVEGPGQVVFAGTGDAVSDGVGSLSVVRSLAGTGDAASDALAMFGTAVERLPNLTGMVTINDLSGSVVAGGLSGSVSTGGLTGTVS